jgi:hypothetical protein
MEINQLNSAVDKAIQAADQLRDYLDQFPVKQQRKMLERIRECDCDPAEPVGLCTDFGFAKVSDYQPWGGLFRHPRFPQT